MSKNISKWFPLENALCTNSWVKCGVQEINTFTITYTYTTFRNQLNYSSSLCRVTVAKQNIIFHLVFCDKTNKNLFLSRKTDYTIRLIPPVHIYIGRTLYNFSPPYLKSDSCWHNNQSGSTWHIHHSPFLSCTYLIAFVPNTIYGFLAYVAYLWAVT